MRPITLSRRHFCALAVALSGGAVRRVVAATPAVVTQPASATSSPAAVAAIDRLRRALEGVEVPADVDPTRDLRWLDQSLSDAKVAVPEIALQALDALTLVFSERDRVPAAALRTAFDDLALKASYCRTHPDGMAALVRLTVRTFRQQPGGRVEDSNWQVFYLNAPLVTFAPARSAAFPAFSSPTSMSLPPGVWAIWAQDVRDAAKKGPITELRLGVTGTERDVTADIAIP